MEPESTSCGINGTDKDSNGTPPQNQLMEIALIKPTGCKACGTMTINGKFNNNGNPLSFTATFSRCVNNNSEDDKKRVKSTGVTVNPPDTWSEQDVFDFIKKVPGCAKYAEDFVVQNIDGKALMLLKKEHLINLMDMKLGPALKIIAEIDDMRVDKNHSEQNE